MSLLMDVLPTRSDSAAANMAVDFLMLQHYPDPERPRWRHYQWRRPAVTFGYGQKIAEIRAAWDHNDISTMELCRRPSGGGIVDHRDDWTYALVIPRRHDLGAAPASESYSVIHQVLAEALQRQNCPAVLQPMAGEALGSSAKRNVPGPSVCFTKAEPADVIRAESGRKIAGAAQKRSKRGLLLQGSIARSEVGEIDWDQFEVDFIAGIAACMNVDTAYPGWPETWDETVDALAEDYASEAWLERR
ncbi:MAG: hypothetical protein SynsKO_28530 [Synoicihabitans sp.]